MKRYLLSSFFFIAVMFAFTPTLAHAKPEFQNYCDLLTADDCELMSDSESAMEAVASEYKLTELAITVRDIENFSLLDARLDFEQKIIRNRSPEHMDRLNELRDMAPDLALSLITDFEQLSNLSQEMAMGVSTRREMSLAVSGDLAQLIGEQIEAPTTETITVSLNTVVDSGRIYIDMDVLSNSLLDLIAQIPEGEEIADVVKGFMFGGWIGFELAPLYDILNDLEEATSVPPTPPTQFGNIADSINLSPTGPLLVQIASFDSENELIQYLEIERAPNGIVDGNDVAVFVTSFNFDKFFDSAIFRQILRESIGEQLNIGSGEITEEDLNDAVATVKLLWPVFAQDIVMQLEESISLSDKHLVSSKFLFEWNMLTALQMAAVSTDIAFQSTDLEPYISIEFNTYNRALNEQLSTDVPAGAFVIPAEMLRAMIMSSLDVPQ